MTRSARDVSHDILGVICPSSGCVPACDRVTELVAKDRRWRPGRLVSLLDAISTVSAFAVAPALAIDLSERCHPAIAVAVAGVSCVIGALGFIQIHFIRTERSLNEKAKRDADAAFDRWSAAIEKQLRAISLGDKS